MPLLQELNDLKQIYLKYKEKALNDYMTFLKFQSISSESSYRPKVLECANWVSSYLKEIGFDVERWETSGHPTIFASYYAGPEQPTLLIYNHYDVQPVDPIELWNSPPFEPTIRDGEIYARGAQDNKGQCFYVMFALKMLMEQNGSLPINIKLCIEGEEECGSHGLSSILASKQKELNADYLAVVDLGIPNCETPAITLGLRGLVAVDMEVQGSDFDLHSGSHGGLAFNPLHALVKLLAMTHDSTGKVSIPGFYDDVIEIKKEDKIGVSFDFDEANYEATFGIKPTGGETHLSPYERNWLRPTLEINGISGGYSGDGFKTVIPSKALAKMSCRLVYGQDPKKIGRLVSEFFQKHAPAGIKITTRVHDGGGKAIYTKADNQIIKAFAIAYEEIFNKKCQLIYSGATIPIVTDLAKLSGAQIALVGLGLPDDQIHAPNEHFGIDRIEKGVLSIARVINLIKK
jgi:acetylornithine deacetylase/succinyl-diaminopimelate desuccinylase-like protein